MQSDHITHRNHSTPSSTDTVREALLVEIVGGAYPAGARLPAERDLAAELGVDTCEKPLKPEDLRGADEAFTSTTAGGITPITQVDGKTLGNGAPGILTTRLTEEYWSRREAGWCGIRAEEVLEERDVA